MRNCGTLLHISSLPGEYGIGNFGTDAYSFVDFLKKSGQNLWQILPLGITGYGDSPYQSFSSFAGNPYFIDPEGLYKDGLITKDTLDNEKIRAERVDYGRLYRERYGLLKHAMSNFNTDDANYVEFCVKNAWWLDSFALFMTLKEVAGSKGMSEWEKEYRLKDKAALSNIESRYAQEISFWKITQYYFFKQWNDLRAYANANGVRVIGDIPIYVAADSADVWESPELFLVDAELEPKLMAGCPPDAFNDDGQLWGNPIYDWEAMRMDGYAWWKKRLAMTAKLYDLVRIDHFRGFCAYYTVEAGERTAKRGKWKEGPGNEFFEAVRNSLGNTGIIAEDLGFIDEPVRRLLQSCGFPGMKILEFGFDGNPDNEYLPHNYTKNCFAYTGTHDNDTFMSFYLKSDAKTKRYIRDYFNIDSSGDICYGAVRTLFASCADNVVIPLQDYIGVADAGRMNTPSSLGGNWVWRANISDFNDKLAERIYELAALYGRTRTSVL
ncbi:MAG: 4-alpha-glucanotransferase [Clostridia bacterium]|nr:4-alpha-glucanotransferase [Clostridia bacterium]